MVLDSGHWPLRADRKEMVMATDWSTHDTIVTPPQYHKK